MKHFDILSWWGTWFRWGTDKSLAPLHQERGRCRQYLSQPIAGGTPKQITHFNSELISSFDLSPTANGWL